MNFHPTNTVKIEVSKKFPKAEDTEKELTHLTKVEIDELHTQRQLHELNQLIKILEDL
jgi:hypothetical protein